MVGAEEVVVNGLGHADDIAVVALPLHELADLVAGVHAVVAAVVEEKADVVLLEDLEEPLVVGGILVVILELVSGRAERGRRSVLQKLQLIHIFLADVVELLLQNADDAVLRAVHRGDVLLLQRLDENARRTAVDDGGRTPALAKHTRPFQISHNFSLKTNAPLQGLNI